MYAFWLMAVDETELTLDVSELPLLLPVLLPVEEEEPEPESASSDEGAERLEDAEDSDEEEAGEMDCLSLGGDADTIGGV